MNARGQQTFRTGSYVRVARRGGFGVRQRQQRARGRIRRHDGGGGRDRQRRRERQRGKHRRRGRGGQRRIDRSGGAAGAAGAGRREAAARDAAAWVAAAPARRVAAARDAAARPEPPAAAARQARRVAVTPDAAVPAWRGPLRRRPCATGRMCCGGFCVNLQNDPFNCGACGKMCEGNTSFCLNGTCQAPTCLAPILCGAGSFCCGNSCCSQASSAAIRQGPAGGIPPTCFTPGKETPTCPQGCAPICESDRNRKKNIAPVDTGEILKKVGALPISTWSYKNEPSDVRHLGPMAQDFRASFGLGNDDRSFHSVDAHGVSLAAIQALQRVVAAQEKRIQRLEQQNRRLERQLRSADRAPRGRRASMKNVARQLAAAAVAILLGGRGREQLAPRDRRQRRAGTTGGSAGGTTGSGGGHRRRGRRRGRQQRGTAASRRGVAGAQAGSGGVSGGRGGSGGAAGGRGGSGGASGGRGGGGGTAAPRARPSPPEPGTNCPGGLNCYYEDCSGAGRTIASCVAGSASAPRWQVTTGACTAVTCPNPSSQSCPAGQLCFIAAGGAIFATCGSNTCGTSAISCDCIQGCSGVCTVIGSAQSGITVTCNTCPQGGCP